jgi:hypothetical protein
MWQPCFGRKYLTPENFAAIPMIQNLFTAAEAHEPLPVWFEALKMDSADDRRPNFHGTQAPSLTAWRDHFVREGVILLQVPIRQPMSWPPSRRSVPNWMNFAKAGRRPHSKFPVKWELGFAAYLPHLQPLIKATNVYQLSATAHLARGESAAACDDLRDAVRIYNAWEREPALICGLVRLGIVEKLPLEFATESLRGGGTRPNWKNSRRYSREFILPMTGAML